MALNLSSGDRDYIRASSLRIRQHQLAIAAEQKDLAKIAAVVAGYLGDSDQILEEDFQDCLKVISVLPPGFVRRSLLETLAKFKQE